MIDPVWFALALLVTAGAAALDDLAERRVPNALLAAGLACAAVMHAVGGSTAVLAAGMLAGLVLLPLYLLGGMGAGDVKLLMVLGAFGGAAFALYAATAAVLLFGTAAYGGMRAGLCVRGQQWPFAPALAAGSVLALAQVWR